MLHLLSSCVCINVTVREKEELKIQIPEDDDIHGEKKKKLIENVRTERKVKVTGKGFLTFQVAGG